MADRQTHKLPTEILETIIAHLVYDTQSLKACAATCFAWYNITAPHLHHTLTLHEPHTDPTRGGPNPLMALDKLGLLRLVKKVQFQRGISRSPWVVPDFFDPQSLCYFSALTNLQVLEIASLDFSKFASGTEMYFGRFTPTLRSVTLTHPSGPHQQLLDFLRLFQKLDDIKIVRYRPTTETRYATDAPRAPIQGSLRGRLTLSGFVEEGLLEDIIAAFGGARFVSMDLEDVLGVQFLLDACAETLQTLRVYPEGPHWSHDRATVSVLI